MSLIIVVGGAGYIGSHMMKTLVRAGHEPVAFDNLSTGHADAVIYGELVESELEFDHSKYGGNLQKLLDSQVMNELVWSAKTRSEDDFIWLDTGEVRGHTSWSRFNLRLGENRWTVEVL